MDWTVNPEYEDWMWRHKASNPPRTHHKLAKVLDFFMKVCFSLSFNLSSGCHELRHLVPITMKEYRYTSECQMYGQYYR